MEYGFSSPNEITLDLDVDQDGKIERMEACEKIVGRFVCYSESLLPLTSWRADIDFDGQISRSEFERSLKQDSILDHYGVGLSDEWT